MKFCRLTGQSPQQEINFPILIETLCLLVLVTDESGKEKTLVCLTLCDGIHQLLRRRRLLHCGPYWDLEQ